jgi:1,2-diacylglycerol 3-beta-galactosyltransferase
MTHHRPHILFLMSDTGGGHRAAARAIETALRRRHPDQFTTELVDMWKDYTPFPLNTMPTTYAAWVNAHPASYEAQFWVNDRLFRSRLISDVYCQQALPRMRRLYADHPADVVVCVHSVFVRPAVYALRRFGLPMPFITVITDYALPTVLWYDRKADRCLVPTEPAYQLGLRLGLTPGQMLLTGAPIHPKFLDLPLTQQQARAQLGWPTDRRIALLVGGGDGMGPLVDTARAIDAQPVDCDVVIVAGRNEALKAELESFSWQHRVTVVGFVTDLEVYMRAADILISKGGPATITEAAVIGIPLILSGAIRFQESPNVEYVVANRAGIYAPGPQRVAEALTEVMQPDGIRLNDLATGIRRLAQPDAIWHIADEIWRACRVPITP